MPTKPTPEQIEQYIKAADLELGPTCEDDWVEWCRALLRESVREGSQTDG